MNAGAETGGLRRVRFDADRGRLGRPDAKGATVKKRIIIALAGVGLLAGVVAGPALAGQGPVDRYQAGTTAYTISVLDTYTHNFVVTTNPCDGTIAITGSTPTDGGYYTTETVTGTLVAGVITFASTYDGPYNPGYQWSGSFPVGGGALSGMFTGTVTAAPTTWTAFKNHGEFVASKGGGADAAHSCIGMPKTSGAGMATTASAAAASAAGATTVVARLMANELALISRLEALVARLQATAKANAHATAAISKHIDVLKAGTAGLNRAAKAVSAHAGATPVKPVKPTKPATAPQVPPGPATRHQMPARP